MGEMAESGPILLVVDVQNDFCPGGSLGVPDGDKIIPLVNRAIKVFGGSGFPILATRDWHPRETKHFKEFGGAWPAHCIQGTKGARFHPKLRLPAKSMILSKGMDPDQDSYSAFHAYSKDGRDLESVLRELAADELFLCGLATDYCVRASTLDAIRRGLQVTVLEDAIRGVNLKPGDSLVAIKEMRAAGGRFAESRSLASLLPSR
jgi:nicotinamidase/pyrazinamidase